MPSVNYPKISGHLALNSTFLRFIFFFGGGRGGEANISSAKCYFFVPGYLIMLKRFRKCILHPTLM